MSDVCIRGQGLDPDVVDVGGDGPLDLGLQPRLELIEQAVLHADAECQHSVQELGDRRQGFLKPAAAVHQIEAGEVAELGQGAGGDPAGG